MTIGQTDAFIDEVRLLPVSAQMSTYTYNSNKELTSITNANNITTYYEYDSFGRLQALKDHDGNILKTYTYHYKQ